MASWLLLLPRLFVYTAAAGLRVDPSEPPERDPVTVRHDGGVRLRFPGTDRWFDARAAAVVSVAPGAPVPDALRREGRPLGRAERHWLVPAGPGEDALEVALRWAAVDGVAAAIPDLLPERRAAAFDDPGYGGQWYLEDLGMEALYAETLGDPAVRVAVIDGAVDVTHPDLAASVVGPRDVVDDDDDPSPIPGDDCDDGVLELCDSHGTAVAGLTSARAGNGVGIVGLCPACSLVPIRLLGDGAPLSAEIAAFEHAIEQDAAVINNSWGYNAATSASDALIEVVARATTEVRGGLGAVVVFAAGNDDREVRDDEMVALPGVLCVSALDRYGLPTPYTNFGAPVDLAAPSATVTLAPGGGTTESFGGTSAAAPVAAGVAGWILSYAPELTAEEVISVMVETAHPSSQVTFDAFGHHDVYGYGELDPPTILAALNGTWTEPGPTPVAEAPEDPRGCGCQGAGGGSAWLALLLLRRRR